MQDYARGDKAVGVAETGLPPSSYGERHADEKDERIKLEYCTMVISGADIILILLLHLFDGYESRSATIYCGIFSPCRFASS